MNGDVPESTGRYARENPEQLEYILRHGSSNVFGHASAVAEQLQVSEVAVLRLEQVELVAEVEQRRPVGVGLSSDASMRSRGVSI
jgi:hypothetical protein